MSYTRKTWVDRVSEYPTRRILTDTSTNVSQQVTVQRAEGVITTPGDSFDAETMNNFEGRIASAFTTDQAAIGNLSQLDTTDKDSLVEAINEVKGDIPQNVPRNLSDLNDTDITIADTYPFLMWDGNTSKWVATEVTAAEVAYTPASSMPSGYTDIQLALDYLADKADTLDNNKVDDSDFYFEKNEEFSLTNGIFAGSLTGGSKNVYIFIPLPKSTARVSNCTVSGNWYIRGISGHILSNATLASAGTVTTSLVAGGVQIFLEMSTAHSTLTNTPLTALAWTNAKLTFS